MWYLDYINHCFFIAFILLIWLKTEAILEYAKLLGLSSVFKVEDFQQRDIIELSYPQFLLVNYDNFITRLVNCPICLGFWFNIILCVHYADFSFFFVKNILTILIYSITCVIIKKA